MRKEMDQTRRQLERDRFTATLTAGGHWKFEHPKMSGSVFTGQTPGDRRAIAYLRSELRRGMLSE